MITDQWIGLESRDFYPYRHWITPSGYLCGTYAAATLLAYYQDHIDPTILPVSLRQPGSPDGQTLVDFLHLTVQPHGLPTLPFQVAHGMGRLFRLFQRPYRARTTQFGGWQRVTKRLQAGKPVILGLMKAKGSTYGNHWVVAYAYQETAAGERYFKVHDNWGGYDQVIPASWANGTVSLP